MVPLGGLRALLVGWIGYRTFLYDPSPIDIPTDDASIAAQRSGPEPKPSKDVEARFMFNRAQELHRNKKTDQAIDMLNKVVKVYKDTPTATEAKAALDRTEKNLPLFATGPIVVAEAEKPAPAPATPAPRAVVDAKPMEPNKGQAALVLPANPSEAVVVPPSLRSTAGATKGMTTSRPLPPGFQANLQAGVHESGWPLVIVGDRDGTPMLLVPGGTFTMGSDDGLPPEKPAHQVRLSAYYIDQHEVTNHTFRIFLSESQYHGQPAGKWLTDEKAPAEPEMLPVVHVSFHDANAYARWAGKRLPTDAARGKWPRCPQTAGVFPGEIVLQTGLGLEQLARSIRSCPFLRTFRHTASSTWRETCKSGPTTGTTRSTISSSPAAPSIIP